MKDQLPTLSLERELKDELRIIEYGLGDGEIHFHSQIEICIVESGKIEALVNNTKKTLTEGDIALSLSYDFHSYISCGDAKYSVLILPNEICEKFYEILQTKNLAVPFICNSSRKNLFLDYLAHIKDESNSFNTLGYVYLILGLIKEEIQTEAVNGSSDSKLLSRLLIYIHQNYGDNLTLNSISKKFGYHPGYISAYFKSHLNIGISRYINIIRLKNAVLLMKQKKQNITQIALECGFSSVRTFHRVCQKELGCSPKKYVVNPI